MKISFEKAKNGDITAIYNNITLHSSYNPTREAERFVQTLTIPYTPPLIIIMEPCVSYIVPLIKEKYSNSKIAIIRYTPNFNKYNNGADYILNYFDHVNNFDNYLYDLFGEEILLTAFFIQWEPSSKSFSDIEHKVVIAIKEVLEKSKTLLVTREYFERKWFINSVNFIKYANNLFTLKSKITIPVLLISSGPSLNSCLKIIKDNQKKFFIICLSSAISVLLRYNIIPDLCITTDGGYWAGQHLKRLFNKDIPIAIPIEGYIQKDLLSQNKLIPLGYTDGLSSSLINYTHYPTVSAERNGTVSGTALKFALDNSISTIYFCGLDMSNQIGYQHTQPNENEINNSISDYKIKSKEKRISQSQYLSNVMKIYKDWFDSLDLKDRKVYRVIDAEYKQNTLGHITDISSSTFNSQIKDYKTNDNSLLFSPITFKTNTTTLLSYIKDNLNTDNWQKKLYPLSYTALTHNENNTDILNRINKDNSNLISKIGKILDE